MYKRKSEFQKSNEISPEIFIDNSDYVNSELLKKIDLFNNYEQFTITKHEYNADLIAGEIYGSQKYSWLLMYINRVSINELIRHKVLNYIPIDKLNEIINSI